MTTWCLTDKLIYPWDGYCFMHEYDVYVPEDFANEFEVLVAQTTQVTDKPLGELAKQIAQEWSASDPFEKAWPWVQDTDALDDYLMAYYHIGKSDEPDSEPIIIGSGLDVSDLFVTAMDWHVEKLVKEDLAPWVLKMWTHKAVFKLELELNEKQFVELSKYIGRQYSHTDYATVERVARKWCDREGIVYYKVEEAK